jgi:hypothetical protein
MVSNVPSKLVQRQKSHATGHRVLISSELQRSSFDSAIHAQVKDPVSSDTENISELSLHHDGAANWAAVVG